MCINHREKEDLETHKQLQEALSNEKTLLAKETAERDIIIQQLRDSIVEANSLSLSEQKYVMKEVRAHQECTTLLCANRQAKLSQTKSLLLAQIHQEEVAHGKIMSYLQSRQVSLQNSLQEWQTKYQSDKEQKLQEFETLTQQKSQDSDTHEALQIQFNALEKIVAEQRNIIRQGKLESLLQKRRERAARVIQSCYRKYRLKTAVPKSAGSSKKSRGKKEKKTKK